MSNKKHKWLVTLEQLKRGFGDDLMAVIADYCSPVVHDYSHDEVIAFLGDYRTKPDISKAVMTRMIKLDIDFARILTDAPNSIFRELVKRRYKND